MQGGNTGNANMELPAAVTEGQQEGVQQPGRCGLARQASSQGAIGSVMPSITPDLERMLLVSLKCCITCNFTEYNNNAISAPH